MKVIILTLLVLFFFSCSGSQDRKEIEESELINTVEVIDSLQRKWTSNDNYFIGERIYPVCNKIEECTKEVLSSNILSISVNENRYVLTVRNQTLFTDFMDSLGVFIKSERDNLIDSGYLYDEFDDPVEMLEISKSQSSILFLKKANTLIVESMKIYSSELILSKFIGIDRSLEKFLKKFNVKLHTSLEKDCDLLLINGNFIKGSWFEDKLLDSGEFSKSPEEDMFYIYQVKIKNGIIKQFFLGSPNNFFNNLPFKNKAEIRRSHQ